jgi:cyanate lyase
MQLTPFGKLVRKHRLEKELTLNEMIQSMAVTAAFASAVETGAKSIPADYPAKVAMALDLPKAAAKELAFAAELSAKEVRIALDRRAPQSDREVVAMFARRFHTLPDNSKTEIRKLLEDKPFE